MNIKSITSSRNPLFRAALKLKTSRGRKQQQRFIIIGEREVTRAIESGLVPIEIYIDDSIESKAKLETHGKLFSAVSHVMRLPKELMDELQFGDRRESIIAVAERPSFQLDQLSVPDNALVVVLQAIEKPGNIGAIMRTMDAVSADAIILSDPVCDILHPNSIRSSMGSVFSIPIGTGTTHETRNWCAKHNFRVFAASDSANNRYTDCDLRKRTALVLGNEAKGLTDDWLAAANETQPISIPMNGVCDSLNVSVAAAVLLFEAHRQRTLH